MKFNDKKLCGNFSLIFLAIYLFTFIFCYVGDYVLESVPMFYIGYFLKKAVYLFPTLMGAVISFIRASYLPTKSVLAGAIPLSAAKAAYLIPNFYISFMTENYDSIESLTFSLVATIADLLLTYLIMVGLAYLLVKIAKIKEKDTAQIEPDRSMIDFGNGATLGFAIISSLAFLYYLIREIIDTVLLLMEVGSSLRGGEIAYIIFCYVFDVIIALLYHVCFSAVRNKILSNRACEKK